MSFSLPHEQVQEALQHEVVPNRSSFRREAQLLVELAIPSILIQLGFTVPPFMTASHVGTRFGHIYLVSYTLANMMGNLSTLSIVAGLFSASDTLSPQAYGSGNYRQVGLLAVRGFLSSLVIIFIINLALVPCFENVLLFCGQDLQASQLAASFYRTYVWALPFNSLYVITWKFLSSQHIMTPIVVVAVVSSLVVLPITLHFCTQQWEFQGAAIALVIFQAFEALVLLLYLAFRRPYHPETWPGTLSYEFFKEAMDVEKCKQYLLLGVGGVLASLEWVYWEALALIVGLLGVIPLSVHSIPTQVILVTFMLPLGLGTALAIRIGATLPRNVDRAKALAVGGMIAGFIVTILELVPMWFFREAIFRLFTNEPHVLQLSEQIWPKVCSYNLNLGVFGINMGIATGLGMQWTLGVTTIVFLWLFGLPSCYYFAVYKEKGIDEAWQWIWPPYLLINAVVMLAFATKDWTEIAKQIHLRESIDRDELETLLMTAEVVQKNYDAAKEDAKSARYM